MTPVESALIAAGFVHQPSNAGLLESTLQLTNYVREPRNVPQYGRHPQGDLKLTVTLRGLFDAIDMSLAGVGIDGYGYDLRLELVPYSDMEPDIAGELDKFERRLVRMWLSVCPTPVQD